MLGGRVSSAALLVTAAGLLAILLAAPAYGIRAALGLGLEFWVGAGLLRLSAQASWSALGVAALIVAVQQLVQTGRPFRLSVRPPGARR